MFKLSSSQKTSRAQDSGLRTQGSESRIWGQQQGATVACLYASLSPGVHRLSYIWVLPPLSNSWIIFIIWLYIALNNRTPNIDCYWVEAVPKLYSE